MQVSLRDLVKGLPSLEILSKRKIDMQTALTIARVTEVAQKEAALFQKVIAEKAKEQGLDKPVNMQDSAIRAEREKAMLEFSIESENLLSAETRELPYMKIAASSLGDDKIEPAALMHLDFLISE